jgi:hypothetical protein
MSEPMICAKTWPGCAGSDGDGIYDAHECGGYLGHETLGNLHACRHCGQIYIIKRSQPRATEYVPTGMTPEDFTIDVTSDGVVTLHCPHQRCWWDVEIVRTDDVHAERHANLRRVLAAAQDHLDDTEAHHDPR